MTLPQVIICDDQIAFSESLQTSFTRRRWHLHITRTLEELKTLLSEIGNDICCIILDIKGLINDNQAMEDASFVTSALMYIHLNHEHIPRVILSGDERDFENISGLFPNELLYQKTLSGQNDMLEQIRKFIDNNKTLKLKSKHPNLFDVFDKGYLKRTGESGLIEILSFIAGSKDQEPESELRTCRKILEEIFKALNEKSDAYLPNDFFTGTKINTNNCIRYLNGQSVTLQGYKKRHVSRSKMVPDHINNAMFLIHKNTSISAHSHEDNLSEYSGRAAIFATCDVLLWFNEFMDSKDPFREA